MANGQGAYAAGTVAGTLTRRYHGLLVAPVAPPLGRYLIVAKADASLRLGHTDWPLFTNRWSDGAISPAGYLHLESFRLEGRMPVWNYARAGVGLELRVWMEPGEMVSYVAYRLVGEPADTGTTPVLRVALLANARDHHGVSRVGELSPQVSADGASLSCGLADGTVLHVRAHRGALRAERTWVEGFDLPLERERGLEDRDNHVRVGEASLGLEPGVWNGLALGLAPLPAFEPEVAMDRVQAGERDLLARARRPGAVLSDTHGGAGAVEWLEQLVLAADGFLFERSGRDRRGERSVIAGYPWFGDWGRDTMVSLAGLTLATGRPDEARRILDTYARYTDRGMLPNVFPGTGERPEFNSVDATLWYFEAWRSYLAATEDRPAMARAFTTLREILRCYRRGTRHGIGVDTVDGLLRAGEPGVQLTWMDARVGDWVVTPRVGKPVEVNALWYNALCTMGQLARWLDEDPSDYEALAVAVRRGFQRYIRPDGLGLYDVLDGSHGEAMKIRPNQVLAVSLPHSPLAPDAQRSVIEVCRRRLLCSYGLRSLDPADPDYHGRYAGGPRERDAAYHQGPVWGWLLGHYVLAEYRVSGDRDLALSRLETMADQLWDAGLGTLGEIFDAEPPHQPRGAPAQAWSVACLLEAWWRLNGALPADKRNRVEAGE